MQILICIFKFILKQFILKKIKKRITQQQHLYKKLLTSLRNILIYIPLFFSVWFN